VDEEPLSLVWRAITNKIELTELTQFQCAQPWPKSPRGRKLPLHPRQWEWDAQRHIRNLRNLMRNDDRVLIGVDQTSGPKTSVAIVHLRFHQNDQALVVVVEVGAVAKAYRRTEPPYMGDQIMTITEAEARAAMADRGCNSLNLGGFIHVKNNASMLMVSRNGWEPMEAPSNDGYVRWGRRLVVETHNKVTHP
jgi:hypothetical protein